LSRSAIVTLSAFRPCGAAGEPTFDSPVRYTLCPVMNDERPAVHDCSP
jgi:hypothetical protein